MGGPAVLKVCMSVVHLQSHNDWDIGEQIDREYDWSKYSKTGLYGVDTPHDNSGTVVSNTLNWSKNTYV